MTEGLPYFRTQDRLAPLSQAAAEWRGTPFAANSASKGVGVSCQFLASELYRAAGHPSETPPPVDMAHARFSRESLVEKWMDSQTSFESVPPHLAIPGDLLGFRIGRTVHHVAVLISAGLFCNVLDGSRVGLAPLADPTWASRLVRAWRPIE